MKKIEDYLPFYLGCEVLCGWDSKVRKLTPSNFNLFIGNSVWNGNIKPILYPLKYEIALASPEDIRMYLKQHYDLFGLIEAGIAIDATKIKTTT